MNKVHHAVHAFIATLALLSFAGAVYAGTLSVKIEQPKSATNLQNININFVVLDQGGSTPITAKCFYNKDGGPFAQFGSDIAISAGGNSNYCTTNSSVINDQATYHFYVTADNGGGAVSSPTVDVVYNTSGPDTPTSYGKETVGSCSYKITFHTANDAKTVKVELYRSENTSFSVDDGSKIAQQGIGPNLDGSFTTDKPDCSKTYYYAIRAFDSIGNASGVAGDSETHTINTTTTTGGGTSGSGAGSAGHAAVGQAAGAVPGGTSGNVLGASIEPTVSPTETPETTPELTQMLPTAQAPTPQGAGLFSTRNLLLGGASLAAILVGVWLLKKKKTV